MRKKVCSCGKIFHTETSEAKCPSCEAFNNYRCSNTAIERREIEILSELRFNFNSTWSNTFIEKYDKTAILGYHSRDLKDTKKHVIHVNLYRFNLYNIDELIETLIHEYVHFSLFKLGEVDACMKYDTIAKKIESWLKE